MTRILVTGGAGYIGSHACKALAAAGYEPVTYDSLVTGWRDAVRFGPFEEGDLKDRRRLDEVIARHNPEAVIHFAALSNVGDASRDPALYWRNNVVGSMTLLDAMAAGGVKRMVFSSTCATYGDQDGVVLSEENEQRPLNAYGSSKLAVEHMLRDYGESHGIAHVIFRYFNVAGADEAGEIGEFHRPETHLIPLCLDAASGRRGALTLFGSDYATRDGTCVRDYIHVRDLVDAHVAGLRWLEGGARAAANLGTRTGFTVREVIRAVEEVTGLAVPMEEGPRRAGDAAALVSGSTHAEEELGWRPERSTLHEMIASAWAWHQKGETYSR